MSVSDQYLLYRELTIREPQSNEYKQKRDELKTLVDAEKTKAQAQIAGPAQPRDPIPTPQSAGPKPNSVTAATEPQDSMPEEEKALIDAVERARRDYASGSNDMKKGAARWARSQSICEAVPDRQAHQWIGRVSNISSDSTGRGVLSITIAPGVQIKTWDISLFNDSYQTLIEPSSKLFQQASSLSVGQSVQFSGAFLPSDDDCILEASVTLGGSVREPEFIMRFSEVSPLGQK
jgi:hypothetical protein